VFSLMRSAFPSGESPYIICLMCRADVERILELLSLQYGARRWHPDGSPVSVLVQTILSQNTSAQNSGRAFLSLLASFPRWEDVAAAGTDEIAASIGGGGLGEVKARRISQALREVLRRRGSLGLNFLKELPLDEARDWLRELPGVGVKTASCVLLFSLGRPALPVDTHIFRVAKKLGLVNSRASAEEAHGLLERLVPEDRVYEFHVLLIEHGRRVCRARRPRCCECVLRQYCPGYSEFGLSW